MELSGSVTLSGATSTSFPLEKLSELNMTDQANLTPLASADQ